MPLVSLPPCLDHGVVSPSQHRSGRGIFSAVIVLGQKGKAEDLFEFFPVCRDGDSEFIEIVAGSIAQAVLRFSAVNELMKIAELRVAQVKQDAHSIVGSECTGCLLSAP